MWKKRWFGCPSWEYFNAFPDWVLEKQDLYCYLEMHWSLIELNFMTLTSWPRVFFYLPLYKDRNSVRFKVQEWWVSLFSYFWGSLMRYLCGKRARKICLGIRWKSKKYLIDIHSMSFREARCWYLFFGVGSFMHHINCLN